MLFVSVFSISDFENTHDTSRFALTHGMMSHVGLVPCPAVLDSKSTLLPSALPAQVGSTRTVLKKTK